MFDPAHREQKQLSYLGSHVATSDFLPFLRRSITFIYGKIAASILNQNLSISVKKGRQQKKVRYFLEKSAADIPEKKQNNK